MAVRMKYYVYRKIPECTRSLWNQSFINKILITNLNFLWINYNLKIEKLISKKYQKPTPPSPPNKKKTQPKNNKTPQNLSFSLPSRIAY